MGAGLLKKNQKMSKTILLPLCGVGIKLLLSGCTGLLLTLSQPPATVPWLVWFAFLPLFFVLTRSSFQQAFIFTFISGFVYYSLSFQWVIAFQRFALLFVAVLGNFLFFVLPLLLIRVFLRKPFLSFMISPSIWVIFEYCKQWWLLKFPFGILGYTQYGWIQLIQITDITGVLGISWIIVFLNVLVFRIIYLLLYDSPKEQIKPLLVHFAVIVCTFGLLLLYSGLQFSIKKYDTDNRLKAGFAQTLFHPKVKWETKSEAYSAIIKSMIEDLSGLGVDLVLFPELTIERPLTLDTTIRLRDNAAILNNLSDLAESGDTHILFGCIELTKDETGIKRYNSAFLFSKDGSLAGRYRKQVLVPFGEFYPFGPLFPWLRKYILSTTDAAELEPGREASLFHMTNKKGEILSFGVLICFESAYADISRKYALQNADFIVNITNDYWSLSSIAMYQHAIIAVFRAIETRKPMLRISNGGFSCYINEFGKYASSIPIFKSGLMTGIVRTLQNQGKTLYTLLGDWLVIASIFACLFIMGYLFIKEHYHSFGKRNKKRTQIKMKKSGNACSY
ncbi:MAG: apolipoprotein N-acyltransferase [Spirochaetales bacterium]|nr:apolipoprotein N-acyltransferase [Spirochaetales bacterium]